MIFQQINIYWAIVVHNYYSHTDMGPKWLAQTVDPKWSTLTYLKNISNNN